MKQYSKWNIENFQTKKEKIYLFLTKTIIEYYETQILSYPM